MTSANLAYPAVSKISINSADYQLLFEANPIPMFVFDRKKFKFLAVNNAAVSRYGYTANEFRRITLKHLHNSQDYFQLESRFQNLPAKAGSQTAYFIHISKDGSALDMEVTYQPIHFEGSDACLCICNDITEKKSAERALLRSEAHLKALIENAQEAIWAVDAEHRLSFMNNIYKRLHSYHYEVEPFVGMKIYEHFPEKVKELWLARFTKAFSGEKFVLDWHFDIGDFAYEAEVSITPIISEEGDVTGVAYHARDITQRKQAAQALKEREEQYRSLIQNMTEGVLILNPELKLSFANDRFYSITGFSNDEFKTGVMEKLFRDEKAIQLLERKINLIRDGNDVQFELKLFRKSGDPMWAIVNGSPLYAEETFSGALFTLTDITERKRNEEQVRMSEIRYRTLMEAINEGVMQVDLNDNIVFVNKRMCNMLGYQEEELMGRSSLEIFNDEKSKRRIKEHKTLRLTGQSSQYEANMVNKRGQVIPVIVNGTPLYNESGQLVGTLGTFTDVSEIKNSEEKLKESNKELNTFVYKASHDLRGPLATVIGLADLAPNEVTDKIALEYIDKIKSRASRLDNILSELLDTIRIKEDEILVEKLDLHKLCNSVLTTFNHYQGYEDIRFNIHIDQSEAFYSDRKIVFSLLRNLIDNGIKYRDANKEVSFVNVNIVSDAQKAYISIHDNGIGIMKSAQDKIFDMFYRATLTSKGSGLGLYIVKNAVEKLGGTIRFESTEHKGTIFLVELPNKEGTDAP